MRRHSTTVYLDSDQIRALRKLAKKSQVPMAAIIRRGIDLAIIDMEKRIAAIEAMEDAEP